MENSTENAKTDRINDIIDELGGLTRAAKALAASYQSLASIKYGGRNAGDKWRYRFERAGYSWDWIQTGEGNRLLQSSNTSYTNEEHSNVRGNKVAVDFVDNSVRIPFYPQKVNAGIGVPLDASTPFDRKVDVSLVNDPSKSFCLFANGDSMTGAMIADGSFLLCEQTDKTLEQLVGEIVIATVDGVTVVKRLVQESGVFKLRSESTRKYKDIVLGEFVYVIVQGVVLSVHTDIKNYKPR